MKLKPDDLVMVQVKALTGDHKITDQWEDTPHRVINQLNDQPVFQVQPIDAIAHNNIKILHQNMLFPLQSNAESDTEVTNGEQNSALMKANSLMDIHSNN